ncbi:MAG: pyruvate, phosphate dikinase, partial [Acidimicrobiia bacterium]|nr:pyruvate, phosphate dikinase [Acidimicrobiia bacterium]
GKGANIAVMASQLGLPVPPGFTISTEACRIYLTAGWPAGLDGEIRQHIALVEEAVGRRFGDVADPLLVSVRSGAPVSMPGMMDTILNLGLNDDTAAGMEAVSGDPAFVAACRSRFTATYRDIVGTAEVPDDPWQQLRGAVEAVFRSWNSDRARSYRAREGIADDLGTGVTVQAMVFGNRGADSATGVIFTRNPATGEASLYGDLMFNAQGEDVVAGTHTTEPITVLDERMPEIAEELRRYADLLEHHYADVCDIEFTIEQGRLWMLQTRIGKRSPQAALRIAVEMAEADDFPLSRIEAVKRVQRYLVDPPTTTVERSLDVPAIAKGLGASPGFASGEIATTPDAAVVMAEEGRKVILVRRETSPDDVHGMAKAVGILTSTGGLASHAAVVARGWGIPAVVGAAHVRVEGDTVSIGDGSYAVGDLLTIDGTSGAVYAGVVNGGVTTVPEAVTLLSWARELGIEIAEPDEPVTPEPETVTSIQAGVVTVETIVRTLLIKGFAMPDGLAAALSSTSDEVEAVLNLVAADGLAEITGGMFQLTADGKSLGFEMLATDRERWGAGEAAAALEGLIPFDQRMKDVVTGWQMREFKGRQILNDHTDAAHDAAVLEAFAVLHHDTAEWLRTLAVGLPRLATYTARLQRAADLVAAGDYNYLASPRVDSYHGVWFELHEDLILLAGRTREEEVAAGRA